MWNGWQGLFTASALGCAMIGLTACRRLAPPGRSLGLRGQTPAPAVGETGPALTGQVRHALTRDLLEVWFPRCIDDVHGGFYERFGPDWAPAADSSRSLVYQARMTWTAAEAARHFPDEADVWTKRAEHGLDFLNRALRDPEYGGFFWAVTPYGRPIPNIGGEKHAYGIAFAIYAAANLYRANKSAKALKTAQHGFDWLEKHAHDDRNGGWFEALDRDGTPLFAPPPDAGGRKVDLIGTLYGFKSMNTHIHIMEALTALYRIWPDQRVRTRLEEVFEIVRDRIAVPPGCLNQFFTPTWRPVPAGDSFGHDVETAYLLMEAADVLGLSDDPRTRRTARRLVDHAIEWGWDERHGGLFDKGEAFGRAYAREKIWWVQAEALNAFLLMDRMFGKDTDIYRRMFLAQWRFVWEHQIDHRYGGWFGTLSEDGVPHPGPKASPWKAAYHSTRALMNVLDTLAE